MTGLICHDFRSLLHPEEEERGKGSLYIIQVGDDWICCCVSHVTVLICVLKVPAVSMFLDVSLVSSCAFL